MIQLLLRLSALSFVVAVGAGDVAIVQHHQSVAHGIALAASFDVLLLIAAAIAVALVGGGPNVRRHASHR